MQASAQVENESSVPPTIAMRASKRRRLALPAFIALYARAEAQFTSYKPVPRWGHASTFISQPPTLLIHGGKTATGFSYNSAPNTADLLSLDLSSSFSSASAPWSIDSASTEPPVSFHTLSPFAAGGGSYLLFGGDDTAVALPAANDSAWLLALSTPYTSTSTATWTDEATGWANEPIRRVHHSAVSATVGNTGSTVLVYGGLKDDGSGIAFPELWALSNPTAPAWQLVAGTGTAPPALWDHSATWLGDQMIVIGGVGVAAGTSTLQSLSSIYTFEPSTSAAVAGAWTQITVSGTAPSARRGHVAVALNASRILVHGGANLDGSATYADAAILTLGSSSASWSTLTLGSGGPSARYGHSAVLANDQILMAFGYGTSGPADADVYILDPTAATWSTTFSAGTTVSPTTSSATTSTPTSTPAPVVVPSPTTSSPSAVQVSSTSSPQVSASAAPIAEASAESAPTSSSSSTKTFAIAGSVGGAIALAALGAGAYIFARRRARRYQSGRRRTFGRARAGSDGFTQVEKAVPVRQPWRRFDMLEDEEAMWTGRTPSERADELNDGGNFRSPSREGFSDVRLVASYRTDSEPSLFDDPERTPTRKTTRQSQKATPRTYRTAEMEEVEPALLSRSGAFSPSSLYGSTFSPVPATPEVYNPLKRSSTWWNRFAANAGLLKQTPSHDAPIRDPRALDDVFGSTSSRDLSLQPVQEDFDEEDDAHTLREEDDQLLDLPHRVRDESNSSISSSLLEERVKTFDVSQRGPRPSDSASEDDAYADAAALTPDATPRIGLATPGSVVWRGAQAFSPMPPIPPIPLDLGPMSPPSVYAPTPALNQSVRSTASGVKRMAAQYEAEREAELVPSSPPAAKKGPSFVRKQKLFVTNQ